MEVKNVKTRTTKAWDLETPINDIALPIRVYNCLRQHNFKNLAEVKALGKRKLSRMRGFGVLTLDELTCVFKSRGIGF